MLCTVLTGGWCDTVLNAGQFLQELEQVMDQFPQYHTSTLLGDLN
jgi:hypothetical protein